MARSLQDIANDIEKDWGSKVNYGARPYLDALHTLHDITDNYMLDKGTSIVAYFLANANAWRGPTAKKIKKELNDMLHQSWKTPVEGVAARPLRAMVEELKAVLEKVHGVGFGKKKNKPPTGQPRGGFGASLQRKTHMKRFARRRPA